MTLSCVIYPRYSSENQEERSIDDQTRICQAYAERERWNVVAVLPDFAISGATLLRPGYQRLLEMVRGRAIDVVLAESLDRISRDQEHIAAFYKQTRSRGGRVRFRCSVLKLPGAVASNCACGMRWRMEGIQPGWRTPSIMSTWPDAKASVRAVVSAMKPTRSCDVTAGPPKYCGKAENSTPCVWLTLST